MDSFKKDFKFIRHGMGVLATASDQWLMLICLLAALDKPIAWYIWVIFGIEKLVGVWSAIQYKKETDDV